MKPKKSLGQNFLKDKNVLNKIIQATDLKSDDFVIEVGPGQGVLTEELVKHANKLIAIEKDEILAANTAHNFQFSIFNFQSILNDQILEFKNKTAIIIGDILELNLPKLLETNKLEAASYKLVANIPYYITSPIIQLFLETKYPPKEMILMVQREVAERITAKPGDMSILAISVQYYANPELLFYVPKTAFWPIPEVDSAVIHITHNMEHITKEETRKFFQIVRAGFSAKRKTLLNNLANSLHLDKIETEQILKKAGINPAVRAQELSLDDWKKLSRFF